MANPLIVGARAGIAYAATVFAIGFLLGTARVLLLLPRLGPTTAVLLELPIILTASWYASGAWMRRLGVGAEFRVRVVAGVLALLTLIVLELLLAIGLFRSSMQEYLAGLRSSSGTIGLAGQVCFATFPLLDAMVHRAPDSPAGAQRRLALIRGIHTAIYLVMAASTFVVLYAGISRTQGIWLWMALVLLGVEVAVFVGNGLKCPLTALAVQYGARTGHVFDTFLPEKLTRYTFRVFGTILVLGLILILRR